MKLPLSKWIKALPDFPCVFLTRDKFKDGWEYNVHVFEWVNNPDNENEKYLGWHNGIGEEMDSIQDMHLGEGEVFIVEKIKELTYA